MLRCAVLGHCFFSSHSIAVFIPSMTPASRWRPHRSLRAIARVAAIVTVCATCDAPTALEDPGVRPVELTWLGDTVLVAGSSQPLNVNVTVDGEPYAYPRFSLVSSDTTIVGIAGDGTTLEARRLGSARVTVHLRSAALPSAPPSLERVIIVAPKSMRVLPGIDTLRSVGDTLALTASALDVNDQPLSNVPVTWTSSDPDIATVDARGIVRARTNGSVEITAEAGTQTATAEIAVRQRAIRLALSASAITFDALGAETTLVATAVDARGAAIDGAEALTWESSTPAVATVMNGVITARDNGTTWIRARSGIVRDSVWVDVAQRAERVVIESSGSLSLTSIGQTAVVRARGYDRRGNEISTPPFWRSVNQAVAHVDSRTGIVTALAQGTSTVIAEMDTARASLAVTVADVAVLLEIFPSLATLTSIGDTLPLHVVARNALGTVIASPSVQWRSANESVGRMLADGRLIAVGTGVVRAIATSGSLADTSIVTVVNAADQVDIVPSAVTLPSIGDSLAPAVVITNARGALLDRSSVVWSSNDPGVARVTTGGIIIAVGLGEARVTAVSALFPDRRDSLLVTVTNAPASVTIDRAADTLNAVGRTRAYGVEVRNSRGALIAVTPSWRSVDPGVAAVTATGVATAVAPGLARLVASAGAVADTLLLTVRDVVTSLDLTPPTLTLGSVNDTVRLSVTARNELGSPVLNPPLAWFSSDASIVRVLADGRAIAAAPGTARAIVVSGAITDTTVITVTNAPVFVDIARTADTLFAIGDSLAIGITVRNARGDALPRSAVTWTSDDPLVVRVSTLGVVTARDTGRTWIRALGSGVSDSTRIVVTNDAASVQIIDVDGIQSSLDTLTAPGQSLSFLAQTRNRLGALMTGVAVSWRSTLPAVASVSSTGVLTATGYGTTLLVATAGLVADTVRVVVVEPSRHIVNNAVIVAVRVGTEARPYATIQQAVNAAGVDDTVIVRRGNGYSEAVTLARRVTLLGDSAAFVAGGRNPLLLPRLAHDLGAAGIAAATAGSSYTIRYLAIQHSVDGEAIVIRDAANVLVENVFVNPVAAFRTGRGILIDNASASVTIARSQVDSVVAFGVRVRNSVNARIDGVGVSGVSAAGADVGAGIELVGGTGGLVRSVTVQRAAGPHVLLSGTRDAALMASTLLGEQPLARLTSVLGTTTVRGNTFDLRRQPGDPLPTGSSPDPAGLDVTASAGVLIDNNTFIGVDGRTSQIDGVRLADVRVGTSGASYGALLTANRFGGGRSGVRSERSSWRMTNTRIDSAGTAVLLTQADSVVLDADTLVNARVAAIQSTGGSARIELTGSVVTGAERALVASNASRVIARRNTISGGAPGGVAQPLLGAVDVAAVNVEIVDNTIRGVRAYAGLVVRGVSVRVDSNLVMRNLVGIRLGGQFVLTMRDNAVMDNDTLPATATRSPRGLVNDGSAATVGANWWGDDRGPRRGGKSTFSVGDSIIGSVSYDSLAAPIDAHRGSGAVAGMFDVFGDGQLGAISTVLPAPMVVRVVDASGRPLAGASVLFRVTDGGGDIVGGTRVSGASQRTVVTNASGLAQITFTLENKRGVSTITASSGAYSIPFTATVP